MRKSTGLVVPLLVGLALGGTACQAEEDSPPASRDSTLPVVSIDLDEDGPTSVEQAIAASDYVVVARIARQRDGVRFYGDDVEESKGADAFETVEWTLDVERWLKGRPNTGETLTVRSPAYLVDDVSSPERVAVVEWGGVEMPLRPSGRYVFFLEQHPEPWGLITVSAGAGIMQLDATGHLEGEISNIFTPLEGSELEEVLPPAVAERL